MAGAFGFEKDHYHVSIACGERVLLPAVRNASKDTLLIADGFSCREQVRQTTDRQALHLAQVVKMAIDDSPHGPPGNYPEKGYLTPERPTTSTAKVITILGFAILGILCAGLVRVGKSSRKG